MCPKSQKWMYGKVPDHTSKLRDILSVNQTQVNAILKLQVSGEKLQLERRQRKKSQIGHQKVIIKKLDNTLKKFQFKKSEEIVCQIILHFWHSGVSSIMQTSAKFNELLHPLKKS